MRKHWLSRTKRILKVGADRAEQFDVVESEQIEPGDLLVINQGGTLQCSNKAYDKTVTGVVSAAGMHRTGIVLDQQAAQEPASNGIDRESVLQSGCPICISIDVGDLLTTSSTSGHAMKASDPLQAFGAVIGKSLCPLKDGRAIVPILIALQLEDLFKCLILWVSSETPPGHTFSGQGNSPQETSSQLWEWGCPRP
jgi:hypothetical protein